jgi:two-component system alkaline phosphatase synthesis response regulator PhoP
MTRLLIVEDDAKMLKGLRMFFASQGYEVLEAADGQAGIDKALGENPEVMILDVMLPKVNGFDVCKRVRARNQTLPIILLTAKGEEVDKVVGLEIGADDYVVKPFSPKELEARVRALLRRSQLQNGGTATRRMARFGDIEVDFSKMDAFKSGKSLQLTSLEFQVLAFLVDHAGEVVTRDSLLDKVWGYDTYPTTRTIDTHMLHLRQKIEDDPKNPSHLRTAHGKGYILDAKIEDVS